MSEHKVDSIQLNIKGEENRIKGNEGGIDAGGLKSVVVTPAFNADGYEVVVTDTNQKKITLSAQRSDNHPRVFRSIDAAMSTMTKLGLRKVTFILPT